MKDEQPRIVAKVTNDWVDYPHNDLSNAAWFFRERINKAFAEKERTDGIFLDMMACATMIAFSLEGYVNFIGSRVIDAAEEWNAIERQSVKDKIKAVRKRLGIEIDWNQRPYTSVDKLVGLRNLLAHPKAHKAEPREWVAEGTDSTFRKMLRDYEPAWVKVINQAFIDEAYEDVEAIWTQLLEAAGIAPHETWSGGSQGFELIEHVAPEKRS